MYTEMLRKVKMELGNNKGMIGKGWNRSTSPVIRVGYSLRMSTVLSYINTFSTLHPNGFNLLSIGAGLDPLPHYVKVGIKGCRNAWEMDDGEIVELKKRCYEALGWSTDGILPGCNLNSRTSISSSLSSINTSDLEPSGQCSSPGSCSASFPTLIISEVVLTYVERKTECLKEITRKFGKENCTVFAYESIMGIPSASLPPARLTYSTVYSTRFNSKVSQGQGGSKLHAWRDGDEVAKDMREVFGEDSVTSVMRASSIDFACPKNLPSMFDEHAELALYLSCYAVVVTRIEDGPYITDWGEYKGSIGREEREGVEERLKKVYEMGYEELCKKWGAVRRMVNNAKKKDFHNIDSNFVSFTCLVDSGKIVGFCGVKSHGASSLEVSRFVVDPNYRGKGWGKKLLNHAISSCGNLGNDVDGVVWAKTIVECKDAIGLYLSMGWVTEGREEGEVEIITLKSKASGKISTLPTSDQATQKVPL